MVPKKCIAHGCYIEGCVAGVMRDFILRNALEMGIEAQESAITPDELLGTDEVFLTNAIRGMVPVRQLAMKTYETRRTAELYKKVIPFFYTDLGGFFPGFSPKMGDLHHFDPFQSALFAFPAHVA